MSDASRPDGEVLDAHTVRFRRLMPGPIEPVWAYLTEADKRAKWFAGGEMELRADGNADLFFQHANLAQPDETPPEKYRQAVEGLVFNTRITRCEPPHVLAFLWSEGRSEVIFELAPQGDKVLLTLTHRKLPTRAEIVDVSGGWHLHLTMLQHQLEGTPAPRFWDTHAELEKKYEKLIPQA